MMMMETNSNNLPFQNSIDHGQSHVFQNDNKTDNMDISLSAPPDSPEMKNMDAISSVDLMGTSISGSLGIGGIPQPKIQTAFINKLYA